MGGAQRSNTMRRSAARQRATRALAPADAAFGLAATGRPASRARWRVVARPASRTARPPGSAAPVACADQRIDRFEAAASGRPSRSAASPGDQRSTRQRAAERAEQRQFAGARAGPRSSKPAEKDCAGSLLHLQRQPAAPELGLQVIWPAARVGWRSQLSKSSKQRTAARRRRSQRGDARHRSQLDAQALERFLQRLVLGVEQQAFPPDGHGPVALAHAPEHLAQVRGDLGVGLGLVGRLEDAQRPRPCCPCGIRPSPGCR